MAKHWDSFLSYCTSHKSLIFVWTQMFCYSELIWSQCFSVENKSETLNAVSPLPCGNFGIKSPLLE